MRAKYNISKITADIESGLKFKAANQLRNLINIHPNEMELRDKLANLYYDAGFFDAAGKYWILKDSMADHVRKCVAKYEGTVNYSARQILFDLKFRGDKELLSDYAKKKLIALEEESMQKSGYVPNFTPKERIQYPEAGNDFISRFIGAAVIVFLVSVPIFAIIGIISLF